LILASVATLRPRDGGSASPSCHCFFEETGGAAAPTENFIATKESYLNRGFQETEKELSSQQSGVYWDPGTRVLPQPKTPEFFKKQNRVLQDQKTHELQTLIS
jgi:hypothetical protein